jgi:ADP-ribosylation factor protein 1
MIGLDSAGKTSILFKLKLDVNHNTIPTIGFNVETVQYKKVNFTIWDAGGQDKIRQNWVHYCANTNGLIFVIDSADRDRIGEAREELHKILNEEAMKDSFVLVYANKQDLPSHMTSDEISTALSLDYLRQKNVLIQPCTASSGEGLYDGMEWLSKQM